MKLQIETAHRQPPILKILGSLGEAGAVYEVCNKVAELRFAGCPTVCLDFSQVYGSAIGNAFALVEIATREANTTLISFDIPKSISRALGRCEMHPFLKITPDRQSALEVASSISNELIGATGVLLCAGFGRRMGPLAHLFPKATLDFFGKSALARMTDHCADHGVRQLALNPGHLGNLIPKHIAENQSNRTNITYHPEGVWSDAAWIGKPIGSASALLNMYHHYHAISGDIIVMSANALTNINLREMMAYHRKSGADITIAANERPVQTTPKEDLIIAGHDDVVRSLGGKADSRCAGSQLTNTGIIIISEAVLAEAKLEMGLDIKTDFLPSLLSMKRNIFVYRADFECLDIKSEKDYSDILFDLLAHPRPWIKPVGKQVSKNTWVHEDADIENIRTLKGPAYVGKNTFIHRSAHLKGPSVVGANCSLESHAFLKSSVLLDGTRMVASSKYDGVIAANGQIIYQSGVKPKDEFPEDPQSTKRDTQIQNAPLLQAS